MEGREPAGETFWHNIIISFLQNIVEQKSYLVSSILIYLKCKTLQLFGISKNISSSKIY